MSGTGFLPSDLPRRLCADPELRTFGPAWISFTLAVREGEAWRITFSGEEISAQPDDGSADPPDFRVELTADDWSALLDKHPLPRTQHVLAFVAPRGSGAVTGNAEAFAQHLHLVRRVIELARDAAAAAPAAVPPEPVDVIGRYVRVDTSAWGTCDVFYESSGSGPPVILLATAGADSSQYRGLLTDQRLTATNRLIAVDLPWHGKSLPPYGRTGSAYQQTSDSYTEFIARFVERLALPEKPVLVGASMAGAVVVEMAARYPRSIRGAVGCQAGPRVANRHTPWLRNPRVNQTTHVPEWTFGLMSPESPRADRDWVWWGYSQGGFGVYERDIVYYSTSWDIDNVRSLFGPHTPPVVLLSGVYDYTVPPSATRELAEAIPGARFREMPELGHFPHAENPSVFAGYLTWALEQIASANSQAGAPADAPG